jgi:hypothetical protein
MLAPQFAASFIGSREANNLSSRLAIWAGEFRHPIAMSFDVNPDRISDVIRERIQAGSSGSRVAQESCPRKRGEIQQTRARLSSRAFCLPVNFGESALLQRPVLNLRVAATIR